MGALAEEARANCGPRPKTCPAAINRTPITPRLSPTTPRTPRTSRSFPRTPIPNTIDPISKEVKYGDPNHRECERSFRPASAYLPREKYSKYSDKTHTSVRTIRLTSGAIWAIPHPLKPTGYKKPGAYLKFNDLTSKNYFEKRTSKAGEEMDSLTKKPCPYSPTAYRNLPLELRKNPVGLHSRDCRNASYLSLVSGKHGFFKTPKTTNQSYLKRLANPTGFNNPVIFADKTKMYHRLQRRFD
ncbi:hypothetical protein M758_10G050500 [Ceratodon purpureus]|nr:hypothetical protein M758_10G050500 [Ceratodon purpureus]